jgi:hypothetical protein
VCRWYRDYNSVDRVGILTWSRAHGDSSLLHPYHTGMSGSRIVEAMMEGAAQGCVYSKLAQVDGAARNDAGRPCGGKGSVTFNVPSEREVIAGVIPEQDGASDGSVDFADPDVRRLLRGHNDDTETGLANCSTSIGSARSDNSDVQAAARSSSKVAPVDLSPRPHVRGMKSAIKDLESSRVDGASRKQRALPDETAAGNNVLVPRSHKGSGAERPGHKEGSVASGSSKHSTVVIHKAIEHDAKVRVIVLWALRVCTPFCASPCNFFPANSRQLESLEGLYPEAANSVCAPVELLVLVPFVFILIIPCHSSWRVRWCSYVAPCGWSACRSSSPPSPSWRAATLRSRPP